MLSKSLRVLTALSTALAPVSGVAADSEAYFFRHVTVTGVFKDPGGTNPVDPTDPEQDKDITAFFAAGVGVPFEQRLPLRSDWQDDAWSISSGSLPAGISFDAARMAFSGTPTRVETGKTVKLRGIDREGREVASATVTFDVTEVEGQLFMPEFYAHTGKYKFDQLPLPEGVAVAKWGVVERIPDGVNVLGRNYEGTPTKSGVYPISLKGMDYNGNVVATYIGTYLVEDGPTFPTPAIPDMVGKLPQVGGALVSIGAPSTHSVAHGIDGLDKVRYYLQIAEGDTLPGQVASNDQPKNLRVTGRIYDPYQTASIRYKAIDTDGTVGFSNWFRIGTTDPQPSCGPVGNASNWKWKTGVAVNEWVPAPKGAQGTVSYELVSGDLPTPLVFDPVSGTVKGTATAVADPRDIVVRVNVTNGDNVVSTECLYSASVGVGSLALVQKTSQQARHIRVGGRFDGLVEVVGGIPPFKVEFKDTSFGGLDFTTPNQDIATVGIGGTVTTAGIQNVGLTVSNGDGNATEGAVTVVAHPPLAMSAIADIHVKRHAASQTWGTVSYDQDSVIPDMSGATVQPGMTLDGPVLPASITFDAVKGFSGATSAAVGTYGPYTVVLSDFSGDTFRSQPFNVIVDERDPLVVTVPVAPVFTTGVSGNTTAQPVGVKQPSGAVTLTVTYALNGPQLPQGISFDAATGELTAQARLPFDLIDTYGPYTVTATDEEGFSATSSEFDITVQDMGLPMSGNVPETVSNVSGKNPGELPTFATTPALRGYIRNDTVYGGSDGVTFLSADPANPAGLAFDPATGSFSGEPTSEFSGSATVTAKDAEDREFTIPVPVKVLPYPSISMSLADYSVARLSSPTSLRPVVGQGFRGTAAFSLVSGTLPAGLSVDPATGALSGRVTAAVGLVARDLVIGATDTKTMLPSKTSPFSVTVTPAEPMAFAYSYADGDSINYTLKPDETTGGAPYTYASGPSPSYTPKVSGSFVTPLSYSIDTMPSDLSGIAVRADNGLFNGSPTKLGSWNVDVRVTDAENKSAVASARIVSTMDGFVVATNGVNAVKTLRVGEPFRIPDDPAGLATSNKVGSVSFFTDPAILPSSVVFDALTGSITDESRFLSAVTGETIYVGARDQAGRGFRNPLTYRLTAVDPLGMPSMTAPYTTTRFGVPFNVQFPAPLRAIGDISYSISGSAPGTLVQRTYDTDAKLTGYAWTFEGQSHVLSVDAGGVPTRHTVGGSTQSPIQTTQPDGSTVNAPASAYFPIDALMFDPLAGTLKGTPSAAGSFPMTVTAADNHADGYIRNSSDRIANNRASASFALDVADAVPMSVSTSGSTTSVARYGLMTPFSASVSDAAYGKAVTWSQIAGTLPQGVKPTYGASGMTLSGYPQTEGTYSDLRFRARDAGGRTVETAAFSISVGPRIPLKLVGTTSPYMAVNEVATAVSISAENSADGLTIPSASWQVLNADKLPDGVRYAIADVGVTFSGTPTKVGQFAGVSVAATDSKGGTASLALTFNVVSPTDEIALTFPAVKSKPGKTFDVTPTATNTYGTLRYTSPEISSQYSGQMTLDRATGRIAGGFATVGDRTVNVTVTDETNRLTSRQVPVQVIPVLQVTVPSLVTLEQYKTVNAPTDVFNKIGTVKFAKGNPAAWPQELGVDEGSGKLTGTLHRVGRVDGLFITATDTFGQNTDTQVSNTFSVNATKAPVDPDIVDISGMKLFTATTAITPIEPSVVEKQTGKAWAYGGLTFTLNGSLQTGLNFDTATGKISGTPAEPSYTEGLTITVSDADGNKDTTTAFDIAVRDIASKLPYMADYAPLSTRLGVPFTRPSGGIVGKPSGRVSYAIVQTTVQGLTVDANGLVNGPATSGTSGYVYVLATDQSGYQLRISGRASILAVTVVPATLTYADISLPETGSVSVAPTSSNLIAPVTYTINKALPNGVSLDSGTGRISGNTSERGAITGFVVTATDSAGNTASNAFSVSKSGGSHRIVFNTWYKHQSLPQCVALGEMRVMAGSTDITAQSYVSPANTHPDHTVASLTDGLATSSVSTLWANDYRTDQEKAVYFSPPEATPLTALVLTSRGDGYAACTPSSWTVQKADGNGGWTTLWNGTAGSSYRNLTTKP